MRTPRLARGTVIQGRFTINEMIGSGGMAYVYSASDDAAHGERDVAVKVMSAKLAEDPKFQKRFEREANVAYKASHPNILPIWDSGTDGHVFYIVTPLADTDLGSYIERHGPVEVGGAVDLARQVARALDRAHELGVIHRDVKPENVLLVVNDDGSAHAYLADFGIAKDSSATTITSLDRTPLSAGYCSPEQARGDRDLDARSDQYSLACTLYDALCGHAPFVATRTADLLDAHLSKAPEPLSAQAEGLPAALDAVFARALAKDPADRYSSCGQFAAALRNAAGPAAANARLHDADATIPAGPPVDPGAKTVIGTLDKTVLDDDDPRRDPGWVDENWNERTYEPDVGTADTEKVPRRRAPLVAAAVVVAALAAGGVAYAVTAGGGEDTGDGPVPTPTVVAGDPAPTETATPEETTEPEETPTETPTPEETPEDTGSEPPVDYDTLVATIPLPSEDCAASGPDTDWGLGDTAPDGMVAAASCDTSYDNQRARYFAFETADQMDAAYDELKTYGDFTGEGELTARRCPGDDFNTEDTWEDTGVTRGRFICRHWESENQDWAYVLLSDNSYNLVIQIADFDGDFKAAFDTWIDATPD
jgi:serine/threonine-protein kinase